MGLICNINKNRFIEFAGSLEERPEPPEEGVSEMEFVSEDGRFRITFHTFTLNIDGNFTYGNGNWDEALNKIFKSNKGD